VNENELIGRLLEEEKYKFVDHRIIAEVVRDVYKLQAIPEEELKNGYNYREQSKENYSG
jgi:hypothetical protein